MEIPSSCRFGEHAVEPLIRALSDSNDNGRIGAADALGKIGDSRAVEPLTTALNFPSVNIRNTVAESLSKIRK